MVDCQPHSIQYQLKSVYFGSVYLCKKYYPRLIFYLYFSLVWLLIALKKGYYMCMKTDASSEWVTELTHLQQRLAHDI